MVPRVCVSGSRARLISAARAGAKHRVAKRLGIAPAAVGLLCGWGLPCHAVLITCTNLARLLLLPFSHPGACWPLVLGPARRWLATDAARVSNAV
jgi:hypothetical protein